MLRIPWVIFQRGNVNEFSELGKEQNLRIFDPETTIPPVP